MFKRLREVQGKDAAEEVVGELEEFLKGKNAEALRSLHEAGEDLIGLHRLEVPSTLHRNLLRTNAIENSLRNTRNKLGRVTRFRAETDQATRWRSHYWKSRRANIWPQGSTATDRSTEEKGELTTNTKFCRSSDFFSRMRSLNKVTAPAV